MSCMCEQKQLQSDYQRMRKLAKALAMLENSTVEIWKNADGTYQYGVIGTAGSNTVIEYITDY